jgi:hypothetical protein
MSDFILEVNKNGIFVGGKPATHYRGEEILYANDVKRNFRDICEESPQISGVQMILSSTTGKEGKPCAPSFDPGNYAYARVVLNGVPVKNIWEYFSGACSAEALADRCTYFVRNNTDFRLRLLRNAKGKNSQK